MLKVTLLNGRMIGRLLRCLYSAGVAALTSTTNQRHPSLTNDIWKFQTKLGYNSMVSIAALALYQPPEFPNSTYIGVWQMISTRCQVIYSHSTSDIRVDIRREHH